DYYCQVWQSSSKYIF
nr:immunoglobulin light chain junction region [Macaca mulatta]MOW38028.1 immunoglobulin light chain junction region [Macaca mulatta]